MINKGDFSKDSIKYILNQLVTCKHVLKGLPFKDRKLFPKVKLRSTLYVYFEDFSPLSHQVCVIVCMLLLVFSSPLPNAFYDRSKPNAVCKCNFPWICSWQARFSFSPNMIMKKNVLSWFEKNNIKIGRLSLPNFHPWPHIVLREVNNSPHTLASCLALTLPQPRNRQWAVSQV